MVPYYLHIRAPLFILGFDKNRPLWYAIFLNDNR